MNIKMFAITILSIISIGNAMYPYSFYPPSLHPSLHPPLHPKFFFFLKPNLSSLQLINNCTTTTGNQGSCINFFGCILKGGAPSGKCGFALLKSCCEATSSSSLPFANFIGQFGSSGAFTIRRTSSSYCQVRLDFTSFNVGATDVNGICSTGSLTITGQLNTNVPIICGQNSGQHLYLTFDGTTPIMLNVNAPNVGDSWNIKITQIPCSDTQNLAPAGCLQYYPAQTGTVQSFNYRNNVNTFTDGTNTTYQPANMNYLVCLGPTATSFSTITWTRPTGASNFYFTLTGLVRLVSNNTLLGDVVTADYDEACTRDYVTIPNGAFTGFNSSALTAQRFCGLGFPASVTTSFKRFTLGVVFDSTETPRDDGNVGFYLQYTLN